MNNDMSKADAEDMIRKAINEVETKPVEVVFDYHLVEAVRQLTNIDWRNNQTNKHKRWSEDEIDVMLGRHASGMTVEDLASTHRRTRLEVVARLHVSGAISPSEAKAHMKSAVDSRRT